MVAYVLLRVMIQRFGGGHGTGISAFARRIKADLLQEEVIEMPKKKHLKGASQKEQRQYEHIKKNAKKSGRYGKRAEEVAARTVLKHHKKSGHKKGR